MYDTSLNIPKFRGEFGTAISVSGSLNIIGSPGESVRKNYNQGVARVFHKSGEIWIEEAKFSSEIGKNGDYFGFSVSIFGSYSLIGAPYSDSDHEMDIGSAHIFVRSKSKWKETQRLMSSNHTSGDLFGYSVSISDKYSLISAINSNDGKGSAFIFARHGNDWQEEAKLEASDGSEYDDFGWSVSISKSYALIGALRNTVGLNDCQGSAYVFAKSTNGWSEQAILTASDGNSWDYFGSSVSIDGQYALVGAYGDVNATSLSQGSAYIYHLNQSMWTQQYKLIPSDGCFGQAYGQFVSLNNDFALIVAPNTSHDFAWLEGSGYVYLKSPNDQWVEKGKIGIRWSWR